VNEIQVLLDAFATLERDSARAALASIVKVRGSAYRRPGARMLIAPDGRTVGSISAGCLDRDVCERAQVVISSSVPVVATYDTTAAGDDVWGLGLGCAGLVEVLIEPLGQGAPANQMLTFLGERVTRRDPGVAATVFRGVGAATGAVGARLMLTEDSPGFCNVENPRLAKLLSEDARRALQDRGSQVKEYAVPEGMAEAFIEVVSPPAPLLIFGAGDDAVPLARLAKEIGWHVTVVDSRSGFATTERFPWADAIVVVRPEEAARRILVEDRAAAVVMTHNYAHDLELLKMLLPSPVRYLGILGARGRTLAMLRALKEGGAPVGERDLTKIYSPVGMDIGAETPEEIALAILAEIKAVCADRSAGFLRDRRGPIHDRTEAGNNSIGPRGEEGTTVPTQRRSHNG
jgi:xanthine/CO dehydrogenase XdhC/CoxF family maturation factor